MALYLTRFSYTPESWAALIQNPHDRREDLRPFVEAAGGRLIDMYFTFGEDDGLLLIEGDNVSAAAISIAAAAAGGVSKIETTVMMTVDEMLEAMRKATELPYRVPAESAVMA
jgi:uncharacterized protein with GYD domain